ncbi:Eco57I restriction-modification methylase domain-containing protein [Peribacillus glennii]|uniref:site-specific DNA-methyltransferase (adenine-specific) n=1 Tax=Peribacillus glennii TaxID=2303991 RepID=A0A372L6L3_9BACI|nr:N-6 DNA methylase [Peribacillus glennii]RFU60737.1 restriction endonuclease subunit M [Peribacillus glennii]
MSQQYIFNRKYLSEQIQTLDINDIPDFEEKWEIIKKWNYSLTHSNLAKTKEETIQGDFLNKIFTTVLGYKDRIGRHLWNIQSEQKTTMDGTKADGGLGFFTETIQDVRVVIELKDARTDLDKKQKRENNQTPVEQAFSYQYKMKNCKWVIVSNFKEIRLYHSQTMTEYELFLMEDLATDLDSFKKFYYLLNINFLIDRDGIAKIDELYIRNEVEEEKISEKFYADYKNVRKQLYSHLTEHNKDIDEIILFEKTQKTLDRFIFVCFCEDSRLLPENVFRQVIQAAKANFGLSETRIWDQLKALFWSIDKGNPPMDINRFNGGLFKEDSVLDNLIIKDDIFPLFERITEYDFHSELDVNLLGHIFEQSISDIEEFKKEIRGEEFDKNKSKRKRNGVFYTPPFVTRFIVERTIGEWLDKKRQELGEENLPVLTDDDFVEYQKKKSSKRIKRKTKVEDHIEFYTKVQQIVRDIKILDPACGSGAFLNAAFDFLYQKGTEINNHLAELEGGQISLFDLDKHILKHNLYGVDINKESVEITKLSLWLKTANKRDPLTSLDENILCGNSVVADPNFDSNPFYWNESFPEVFNAGGFDIVIGNPPYVRQEWIVSIKPHLRKKYKTFHGRADLYVYFFEKAFEVLKPGGKMGYICSSKYTTTTYGHPLRSFLLKESRLRYFMDFDDLDVFKNIVAYPSIIILDKEKDVSEQEIQYCYFEELDQALGAYFERKKRPFYQSKMRDDVWNFLEDNIGALNQKMLTTYDTLEKVLGKPKAGIKTAKNPAYILSKEQARKFIKQDPKNEEIIKPYLNGKDVKPYYSFSKFSIIFPYKENLEKQELELVNIEDYPVVKAYLEQFRPDLEARAIIKDGLANGSKVWYEYQQINKAFSFEKTYITYPDIANRSSFALTKGNVLDMTLFWIETPDPYRELAILNSSIFNFLFNLISTDARGGYKRFKTVFMTKIPYVNATGDNEIAQLVKLSMHISNNVTHFENKVVFFLVKRFGLKTVNQKVEEWYITPIEELLAEFKKQKVKLSQIDEFNLFEFIETKKVELERLMTEWDSISKKIDEKVTHLYGITAEEKQMILNNL